MLSCSRADECYAEAEMVRPGGPPLLTLAAQAERTEGVERAGNHAGDGDAGPRLTVRAVRGGRCSDSLTPRPAPRAPRLPRHRRPPQGRLPRGAPGTLPPTRGARRGCSGRSAAGPHPHVETLEEGAPTGHMGQVGGWGCPLCTLGPQSVHWGMPALYVHVRICARECAHASVCSSAHVCSCVHTGAHVSVHVCMHTNVYVCIYVCTCM